MSGALYIRLPQGTGAPNILAVTLVPLLPVAGGLPLDLTTVTGVTFWVVRPNGTVVALWMGTIQSGATVGAAVGLYALAGTEFDALGTWRLHPSALVPGGSVPCQEVIVEVTPGIPHGSVMPFDFGYWLTVVPICLPSSAPLTIAAWTLVPVDARTGIVPATGSTLPPVAPTQGIMFGIVDPWGAFLLNPFTIAGIGTIVGNGAPATYYYRWINGAWGPA
jgi:hypothetical protein